MNRVVVSWWNVLEVRLVKRENRGFQTYERYDLRQMSLLSVKRKPAKENWFTNSELIVFFYKYLIQFVCFLAQLKIYPSWIIEIYHLFLCKLKKGKFVLILVVIKIQKLIMKLEFYFTVYLMAFYY